jgi:hypothetical protein
VAARWPRNCTCAAPSAAGPSALVVELAAAEDVNPDAVRYLNRLSDWFFVAGRIANDDGAQMCFGCPGLTRDA